ncbi:MAG: 4'-phosphopantetheinyl transferase, partial [Bacteroidetes bacterium]|nr:4'-phosphopantetheinyl transferase [Bacteroidota bacterium]
MPILHKFQLDNDTQIGVWHITENMDELKWQLQWGIQDIEVFNSYKTPIRAMHWLCSRVLIRQMLYTND